VCIAKTHLSISSDPTLTGAPTGWRMPVREVRASVGAGFIYPICGDMRTMPGLSSAPAAERIDIDETARSWGCPDVDAGDHPTGDPVTDPTPHPTPGPVADPDLGSFEALAVRRRGAAPRGIARIAALCDELGRPQDALDTIHVVGTDGKTSVTRMVSSVLTAHGIRTGDATSPHLTRIAERIRVDGAELDDATLALLAKHVGHAIERVEPGLDHPVGFFEAVTAGALRAFVDAGVAVAVVEAGIGGRGDATAILDARTCVLTPVGLDHPQLGSTRREVTHEKAGVVRRGGTLVVAPQAPDVRDAVREVARARDARLLVAGDAFGVVGRRRVDRGQVVTLRGLDGRDVEVLLRMHGAHQAANASVALAAVQAHLGVDAVDPAAVVRGLERVSVPGRGEVVVTAHGQVLLDGAHDDVAACALRATLDEGRCAGRVAVVIGTSAGRNPVALARRFAGEDVAFVATSAAGVRDTSAQQVASSLREAGLSVVGAGGRWSGRAVGRPCGRRDGDPGSRGLGRRDRDLAGTRHPQVDGVPAARHAGASRSSSNSTPDTQKYRLGFADRCASRARCDRRWTSCAPPDLCDRLSRQTDETVNLAVLEERRRGQHPPGEPVQQSGQRRTGSAATPGTLHGDRQGLARPPAGRGARVPAAPARALHLPDDHRSAATASPAAPVRTVATPSPSRNSRTASTPWRRRSAVRRARWSRRCRCRVPPTAWRSSGCRRSGRSRSMPLRRSRDASGSSAMPTGDA
jgi:dihydrofolate synthase / folylpolyglutamate synthase